MLGPARAVQRTEVRSTIIKSINSYRNVEYAASFSAKAKTSMPHFPPHQAYGLEGDTPDTPLLHSRCRKAEAKLTKKSVKLRPSRVDTARETTLSLPAEQYRDRLRRPFASTMDR